MSPLEIHCLFEYHCFPAGSSSICHRLDMAVEGLLRMGLIEVDPDYLSEEPIHKITGKGTAHVKNLCGLMLPVKTWVLPDE